ncbi:MAG TPA: hypothetical protein VIK40_08865 [Geomonas sp.]
MKPLDQADKDCCNEAASIGALCLGLLKAAVELNARNDDGQLQAPTQHKAGGRDAEPMVAVPRRRPTTFSHQVWSRADGFTLSGARRA